MNSDNATKAFSAVNLFPDNTYVANVAKATCRRERMIIVINGRHSQTGQIYTFSGASLLWTPGQSVLIREVSSFQR